ncbi:MAG: hypothetical protein PHH13_04610 [Candidatus Peribacteraceae bacterium]|nr:hypothetical protein [Candidatus Peribacteraceae bacterium]
MDVDLDRSFLEQYHEFSNRIPHISLQNVANENAYYVSYSGWNKNCYWLFYSDHNQDCCYLEDSFRNQNCMDCSYTHRSTFCYETFFCTNCYNSRYLQGCTNCRDSWFLNNCIGCSNCFGCVNLRQKQYCIFNEQCSKEDYTSRIHTLDLKTIDGIEGARERFSRHALAYPHKCLEGVQNDTVSGNYINNSKNIRSGYIIEHSRDCAYINDCQKCTDCMDMDGWGGTGAQLVYEGQTVGEGANNVAFCNYTFTGASDIYYSDLCLNNCHNLFGCFGLHKKQYCILNKQYTQKEYEILVPKIIARMRAGGEWGQFSPVKDSPYGYNETAAQHFFPLTKEQALSRGFPWKEEEEKSLPGKRIEMHKVPRISDDIEDTICDAVLTCSDSGKLFKIQKLELAFYRTMGLPIPSYHPDIRYRRRHLPRNPRKLWKRPCMKCGKGMETTYAPERPEIVYCEECYLKEVY